ncbi:DUF488 family protein [Pontiellaceae bacterium B1224]|nr:DUF488 family protein [Pontiellaceae bacterium B1224]
MRIQIKRIYDPPDAGDGWRVLVDRLWPRGVAKENAEIDEWAKEASPSPELRKWYSHDPEKWEEFSRLYEHELKTRSDHLIHLLEQCPESTLTLLFAAKDAAHSHAVVLRDVLQNIRRIKNPNQLEVK